MMFNTLTRRFSRSEGGHNGTSRQDSVAPYCPTPYSLPVQGPGPALLPAHPALLEARQLALNKQESISKDREANTPSSQGISLSEATAQEIRKTPLTLEPISECLTTARSPRIGLKLLPRDISNLDLCAALGTYLNYLPLIRNEEEQEEECHTAPASETMESNKLNMKLIAEGTNSSCGLKWHPRIPSIHFAKPGDEPLSTGEGVLSGLGIEEIQSQSLREKRDHSKELPCTREEVTATPPIPPRNPARLLRGHAPEEEVFAASYRWQRRQIKRQTLAAGFIDRRKNRELSLKAPGQKIAAGNPSESRSNVHNQVGRDRVQVMNELIETKDEAIGSYSGTKDQTIGLGIRVKKQPGFQDSENIKHMRNNESCWPQGATPTPVASAGVNGSRVIEANPSKLQPKSVGLGINVYGVCEPFGHGGEDEPVQRREVESEGIEPEDVESLVKVLRAAWKISPAAKALEMGLMLLSQPTNPTGGAGIAAGVESTRPVSALQAGAGVVETAGNGSDEPESPVIPLMFTERVECTKETDACIVAKEKVVVNVGKVEDASLASAAGGDVVPMPAPLSVAAGVAVPRKVVASSSAQPPTASLKNNADLLDEIDTLLEVNYRGQAESFNRKISGASATRSFSTHSGAGATSLRAKSNSTAPTSNDNDTPSRLAGNLTHQLRGSRTPSIPNQILIHSFAVRHGLDTETQRTASARNQGPPPPSPHVTYGHRLYAVLSDNQQPAVGEAHPQAICLPEPIHRGAFYFSNDEREYIDHLVHREPRGCEKHPNCIECYNTEYAYLENKIMPTTMPPEERNKIISNNRSLRNIKNELEALAETGAISDEQFDTIMNALPAESPLSNTGAGRIAQASNPAPPTAALNNMNLGNSTSPPAYTTAAPPSLPDRSNPPKPELTRATALYRYAEAGDCNFEVGDEIAVYEYMNADWWLGKNLRTGQEGVFPVNYVQAQTNPTPPGGPGHNAQGHNPYFGNEKAGYGGGYPPQQQQQYQAPPPAGPSDPYNSLAPPMQIAAGQQEDNRPNKGAEAGKKFGKKLGNAAIFGAGASIGSNIVNSIF